MPVNLVRMSLELGSFHPPLGLDCKSSSHLWVPATGVLEPPGLTHTHTHSGQLAASLSFVSPGISET